MLKRARSAGLIAALGVLIAAVALASCGGDGDEQAAPNVVQPGAPGEPARTLSEDELANLESPKYNDADVRFMQGMVHHHAQALAMTALAPRNRAGRDVRLIARRIALSQDAEFELMRDWLLDRGQAAPTLHKAHGHAHGVLAGVRMPGMLTQARLDRLRAARGPSFDRLFLRDMTFHHQGALTMVGRLYDQGGGLESASDAFARHVYADQEIEIGRMQELLATLEDDAK